MTGTKCLLDTDVIIDCLRGVPQAIKYIGSVLQDSICCVSVITVAELFAGVREGKERTILEELIREFEVAALNENIAQKGGLYRRDYGKSHGVELSDAIIAATADVLGIQLVTLNKKHYPMLKKIHLPYKKDEKANQNKLKSSEL